MLKRLPSFWLLIALLLVGSILRITSVGLNSLWFDEVFSRNVAVGSDVLTIAREGVAGDVHPPLYFILLHGWVRLTGDSSVAMRMLSVLIMILTLPAYYHLGRTLFNRSIGLLTLGLAVISPLQIYYSHEARQYALSMFFVAWMLVGFIRAIRGRGWWLYTIMLLGGLYTHYFTGFVVVALQLWLFLNPTGRRNLRLRWRGWLLSNTLALLLFVPQMLVFIPQAQAVLQSFWIAKPSPAAPLATTAFLIYAITLPRLLEPIVMLLMTCLLILAAIDMRRRNSRQVFHAWLLCLTVVYVPLLIALAISLARSSIYLDRSFSMLEPMLLAALAAAIITIRFPSPLRLLAGIMVILMLVGVANHLFNRDRAKPPYDQIAQALDPTMSVLHLHDSSYLPVSYYAPDITAQLPDIGERSWLLPRTWEIFAINRSDRADLRASLDAYSGKLQVVAAINSEPEEGELLTHLRERACSETIQEYPDVYLFQFEFDTC
jgi:mannosyltransferase